MRTSAYNYIRITSEKNFLLALRPFMWYNILDFFLNEIRIAIEDNPAFFPQISKNRENISSPL